MPWIKFPAGRFETSRKGPIVMPAGTFTFNGTVEVSDDCFIEGAAPRTLEGNPVDLIKSSSAD